MSAVHLQVPRLALRPGRQPDLRPAGGGVLRPRQERATAWCRCTARCGKGSSSSTSPTEPEQSLREFLGPMITDLEGYPFDKMTSRLYYRSEVKANWKLYMDAFQEFYHAPILHANQSPTKFSKAAAEAGFEAPHYRIDGPHRLVSTSGIRAWEMDADDAQAHRGHLPERAVRTVGQARPRRDAGGHQPRQVQPVGPGFVPAVPQLRHPVLGPGLVPDLSLLADVVQHPHLRGHHVLPAAADPRERIAQELAAVSFKEYGLQDANTLEATQTMVESRAVEQFRLCDQEVLLRHLHKETAGLDRRLPAQDGGGVNGDCHAANRIRRTRAVLRLVSADRAAALRQATRQLDGRDAGVLRRRSPPGGGGDRPTATSFRSTTCPTMC